MSEEEKLPRLETKTSAAFGEAPFAQKNRLLAAPQGRTDQRPFFKADRLHEI